MGSVGVAQGICTVVEDGSVCGDKAHARKMCTKHYLRWRKYGDPLTVRQHCQGEDHPNWKGADASFTAQHHRIRRIRGNPDHCEHCGTVKPASRFEWAFNNTGDRNNVWDYLSLCSGCHREFDAGMLPHGEKHHMTTLTETQVIEIRGRAGTLKEIGADFGVSYGTVWNIKNGKTWKHVQGR
jgi:hypothetical protein